MNNIAAERARLNMSQEKLGDLVGKSRQTIQKYEDGKPIPSIVLIKMADIFNVSSDYLLGIQKYSSERGWERWGKERI